MDAASQNSSFLLANLISGQGAGISVSGASQLADNSAKPVVSPFLSSFQQSTQALQSETLSSTASLDVDGVLLAVERLITGHAAIAGTELPQFEGQDFAAEMSHEEVLSVISQLQGEGGEALLGQLSSLLQEAAGSQVSPQKDRQQVDALFANIRQLLGIDVPSSPLSRLTPISMANLELSDQLIERSQPSERHLLERLNAALPQQSPATDAAKIGINMRQPTPEAGLVPANVTGDIYFDSVLARDSSSKPVVTPVPVLLERMAVMANERQLTTGLLESVDSLSSMAQPGKAEGRLSSNGPRPLVSLIQSPLTAPQWQSEFSDKIMLMSRVASQGQNQVAEIRLNPAHLGPIEVRVLMKDEQASIIFSAQHGMVRDAIEASLPRLRDMFSNSGLLLADANVSEHSLQQQHKRERNPESDAQYANADMVSSRNDPTELTSQIDLSVLSSSATLDLYA